MSYTRRDLEENLVRKFGFELDGHGAHGRMVLWLDGRKYAQFGMPNPHSRQSSIGDRLLWQIARQCSVRLGYMKRMLDCTISRDEYCEYLRKND